MSEAEKQPARSNRASTNLEREEAWLWRVALLFVVLVLK